MAGFIQIIEVQTSRYDEIQALVDRYREQAAGSGNTARRSAVTEDRDKPGTYLNIVEFDSYESAMENSKRPETAEFAEQLAKLCDAPPRFRNLDVRLVTEMP
jgi:quinol monooxygenase YgiN